MNVSDHDSTTSSSGKSVGPTDITESEPGSSQNSRYGVYSPSPSETYEQKQTRLYKEELLAEAFMYKFQVEMFMAFNNRGHTNHVALYDYIRETDKDDEITRNSITLTDLSKLNQRWGLSVLLGLRYEYVMAAIQGYATSYLFRPENRPKTLPAKSGAGIEVAQIYTNILSGPHGKPPIMRQGHKIAEMIELYLDNLEEKSLDVVVGTTKTRKQVMCKTTQPKDVSKTVADIDNAISQGWGGHINNSSITTRPVNALRKYVRTRKEFHKTQLWLEKFKEMLDEATSNNVGQDDPIPFNICDVGWTKDTQQRRYQHESHVSSIPHMNLVDAVCVAFCSDSKVRIRFATIQDVSDPRQVKHAEHLNSRLLGAYSFDGGFNVDLGGKNTTSSRNVDPYVWQHGQTRTIADTHFIKNVIAEKAMRDEELHSLRQSIVARDLIESNDSRKRAIQQQRKEIEVLEFENDEVQSALNDALNDALDDVLPTVQEIVDGTDQYRKNVAWLKKDAIIMGKLVNALKQLEIAEADQRD